MISDDDVKQLFRKYLTIHRERLSSDDPLPLQFFRGRGPLTWEGQHPGGCKRHKAVFDKFNIIPKYCFDCYKVSVEARNVVELFKLMVVFEELELPDDNSRKCLVEVREQVSGAYKGLIACRGIEEGEKILELVKKAVFERISQKLRVSIKRGCSEYALAYPEYAPVRRGGGMMEYKEEWQECEDLADKELDIMRAPVNPTFNKPTYTPQDVRVMFAWLKYAATIGDPSYLKIWGSVLAPFTDFKRPPFEAVEDD